MFYYWVLLWGGLMTVIATSGSILTYLIIPNRGSFRWWSIFWGRSMFLGMGIRIRTERWARLDCSIPYVFASNHQILLDIPINAIAVPCPFGFVAKAELKRMPFVGQAIRHSPSVFLDRSSPRKSLESMQRAGDTIRNGHSVIIFPEGARSYRRELLPFKKGTFLLALEAGVPIVPITILDAYLVFNEKNKLARPGTIHVVVGEPISLDGMTRRDIPDLMTRVYTEIEAELARES